MSEMLTVPTAFENIPDLSAGLIDRVDSDQIILYGPAPYEPGATIDFSVLLLDGTPGFEGRGVVVESIDGGDERDDSIRFDIVLMNLELGEEAADIFEGMVLERQLLAGDEGGEAVEVEADAYEAEAEPIQEVAEEDEASADVEFAEEAAEEAVEEVAEAAEAVSDEEIAEDTAEEIAADSAEAAVEEETVEVASTEWDSDSETVAASIDADFGASVTDAELGHEDQADDQDALEAGFDEAVDEAASMDEPAGFDEDLAVEAGSFDEEEALEDEMSFEEAPALPSITLPEEIPAPDDAFRGASPPEAPSDPGGFAVTNELVEGLMRPVEQDVWTPTAGERPEPRPSTGLFQYPDGLPVPSAPPRPDIDESLIVTRAPHPSDNAGQFEAAEAVELDPHEAPTLEVEPQSLDADLEAEEIEAEAIEAEEVEAEEVEAEAIEPDEVESLEAAGYEDLNSSGEVSDGLAEEAESEETIEVAADYEGGENAAQYDETIEYGEVESRD